MNQISDVISGGFAASESPESQEQLEAELQALMMEAEVGAEAEAGGVHAARHATQSGTAAAGEAPESNAYQSLPTAPLPKPPQGQVEELQRTKAKFSTAL